MAGAEVGGRGLKERVWKPGRWLCGSRRYDWRHRWVVASWLDPEYLITHLVAGEWLMALLQICQLSTVSHINIPGHCHGLTRLTHEHQLPSS